MNEDLSGCSSAIRYWFGNCIKPDAGKVLKSTEKRAEVHHRPQNDLGWCGSLAGALGVRFEVA